MVTVKAAKLHLSNAFVSRVSPPKDLPDDLSKPFLLRPPPRPVPRCESEIKPPTAKSRLKMRWLVLMLSSLMQLGNYYCYDNPAALQVEMQEQFADTKQGRHFDFYFEMMYSVYSLPNIFLPLLGGLLVDRVGILFSLVLFSSLLLGGQLLFALGDTLLSLNLMLIGRAVFGLGGESMLVAQASVVTQWFQGKELAMALGVNLTFSRLGSVVNNAISPAVAHSVSVSASLWLGAAICVACWGAALLVSLIDRQTTQRIRKAALRFRQSSCMAHEPSVSSAAQEQVSFADTRFFSGAFWILAICTVVIYSAVLPFNNIAEALLQDRDFFHFGTKWLDAHNRSFVYSRDTPGPPDTSCNTDVGRRLPFCQELAMAKQRVSIVMSEPYILSAVFSPVLGHLVDQRGGRASLILVSAGTLTLVHLLLGFSTLPASALLLGLGFSYCVFAAVLWPSISIVVDSSQVGTGYGVVTALQNFGLFITPLVVGQVFTSTRDLPLSNQYSGVELFFAAQSLVGLAAGVLLQFDRPVRLALNTPTTSAEPDHTGHGT